MRKWYFYWNLIGKQPVVQFKIERTFQIPWGYNIVIIQKLKNIEKATA